MITKQIPEEKILEFKAFLDNKGSDLAKTTEFLSFYALPYIKKLKEHQAFSEIFTESWVDTLRDKVITIIERVAIAHSRCMIRSKRAIHFWRS